MSIGIIAPRGFILKTIFQERILFKCACNGDWIVRRRKTSNASLFSVQLCNFVIAIFAVQLITEEK